MPLSAPVALGVLGLAVGRRTALAGAPSCVTQRGAAACASDVAEPSVFLQTVHRRGNKAHVNGHSLGDDRLSAGSCEDDPEYRDPWWKDSCQSWAGYNCAGYPFSAELQAACPIACGLCDPNAPVEQPSTSAPVTTPTSSCEDDPEYRDPTWKDSCQEWTSYNCTGYPFSAELQAACPIACGLCDPSAPIEQPSTSTPVTSPTPAPIEQPSTSAPVTTPTSSCEDDPEYRDPTWKDSCQEWTSYTCTGYPFSAELQAACPIACGLCDPSTPIEQPGDLDSAMQAILDRHNKYRCLHGVPLMAWSAEIAQNAQAWATSTEGQLRHSPRSELRNIGGFISLGENLAWGIITAGAVDLWYDEIQNTQGGLVDSFSGATGHYTQVVWKSSTSLGCGVYDKLLVCQYGPAGNYAGQFASEVVGPVEGAVC